MGKTLIVAELSANHNGSLETALATIRAAAAAGADAVKLQTYTPDTITIDCPGERFRIGHGTLWDGRTLYDLYREAYTPWEWHGQLMETAREAGLICFSSPFDKTAVDLLETLGVPAYKIASFEITDIPLIEYAASKGKPMIISTGVATESETEEAVQACRRVGNDDITLLKCTSAYPASLEDANMSAIPAMRQRFGVNVGLSDHTTGETAAAVAVALGAVMVEKHFILDRSIGGPDAAFSATPEEFRAMVEAIRKTETALGDPSAGLCPAAEGNRRFMRSLFVVEDMKAGDVITEANVRSIRPSGGLAPKFMPVLAGKKVLKDIPRGTPLTADMVEI